MTDERTLVESGNDFMDAVQIGQTARVMPLARELQSALEDARTEEKMAVQKEFAFLRKADFNELDLIDWCLGNGYLQQALTLCVEWIPAEIVSRRIFYPVDPYVKEECVWRKGEQTWQQYFINDYVPPTSKEDRQAVIDLLCPRLAKRKKEAPQEETSTEDEKRTWPVGSVPGIHSSEIAWDTRQSQYLKMIRYDLVHYQAPAQYPLEILYDYFHLHRAAAIIFHQSAKKMPSVEEIKMWMRDLLVRIQNPPKVSSFLDK